MPASVCWRFLVHTTDARAREPEVLDGAHNMAVDQALFESVQQGGAPVLRFYRWSPACLSLGRNQPARVTPAQLARAGLELVRRPTGGLAVRHDQELTYAVAAPVGLVGSPRATYEAVNRALRAGLQDLGVHAAETSRTDSGPGLFRSAGSCFAGTAPGEVAVNGRKLVGSAQRCERRAILQHGSILLDGDQVDAGRLLGRSTGLDAGATTLRQVLGTVPDWARLMNALAHAFAREIGIALAPGSLTPSERERVREWSVFFASAEWTWRV